MRTTPNLDVDAMARLSACSVVEGRLDRSNVRIPVPTERHAGVDRRMLVSGRASGNHAIDAHLAALAVEWGAGSQSADRDVARHPGLRRRGPLA